MQPGEEGCNYGRRGDRRDAGKYLFDMIPEQKRDVSQRPDEGEQPTEYAAEISGGVAVQMPVVGVAAAALGQHGAEFTEGQRAGEGEQSAAQPNKQHEAVIAQIMGESTGGPEDAGPDHGGDHGGRGGPKPQRAIGVGRTHFSLTK